MEKKLGPGMLIKMPYLVCSPMFKTRKMLKHSICKTVEYRN